MIYFLCAYNNVNVFHEIKMTDMDNEFTNYVQRSLAPKKLNHILFIKILGIENCCHSHYIQLLDLIRNLVLTVSNWYIYASFSSYKHKISSRLKPIFLLKYKLVPQSDVHPGNLISIQWLDIFNKYGCLYHPTTINNLALHLPATLCHFRIIEL